MSSRLQWRARFHLDVYPTADFTYILANENSSNKAIVGQLDNESQQFKVLFNVEDMEEPERLWLINNNQNFLVAGKQQICSYQVQNNSLQQCIVFNGRVTTLDFNSRILVLNEQNGG